MKSLASLLFTMGAISVFVLLGENLSILKTRDDGGRINRTPSPTRTSDLTFSDFEIESYLNSGTVSMGFRIKIPKVSTEVSYMMKITGGKYLIYSDWEFDIFETLKAPPSHPSIPQPLAMIRTMRKFYLCLV